MLISSTMSTSILWIDAPRFMQDDTAQYWRLEHQWITGQRLDDALLERVPHQRLRVRWTRTYINSTKHIAEVFHTVGDLMASENQRDYCIT